MYVCMYGHIYSKSMDQPGKVANTAYGQLNREISLSRLQQTGSVVPSRVSLLISILRLNLVLTCEISPKFRGGTH